MDAFLSGWLQAATTTARFFRTALWAFVLGYLISSMIQVFVTRERMQRSMGRAGPRSVALATGFGFVSGSCSFAALAAAKALFQKGAGLVPALAFLLASTNLVVELGIVIGLVLGWQYVVGEYVGGLMLIAATWALVAWTKPRRWIEAARARLRGEADPAGGAGDDDAVPDWRRRIRTRVAWERVAARYRAEWAMVWRDVLFGFTVAGAIAAFVPPAFFTALFVGSDRGADAAFWQVGLQALIGPCAAFATFIGSMGNVPLAAVLATSGVSFAGVMAFLFSDLVVLPVLRIHARYYGWRLALYVLAVFLAALVGTAIALHYAFAAGGALPDPAAAVVRGERAPAAWLPWANGAALVVTAALWSLRGSVGDSGHGGHEDHEDHEDHGGAGFGTWVLRALAALSAAWLLGGALIAWLSVPAGGR
ncbi:MAG: permease [Planctomycetota bacterium]